MVHQGEEESRASVNVSRSFQQALLQMSFIARSLGAVCSGQALFLHLDVMDSLCV